MNHQSKFYISIHQYYLNRKLRWPTKLLAMVIFYQYYVTYQIYFI